MDIEKWKGGVTEFTAGDELEEELEELRVRVRSERQATKKAKTEAAAQKDTREDIQLRAKVQITPQSFLPTFL